MVKGGKNTFRASYGRPNGDLNAAALAAAYGWVEPQDGKAPFDPAVGSGAFALARRTDDVIGLTESIKEAFAPHASLEPTWSTEETVDRLREIILKQAERFRRDWRLNRPGSPVQACGLVEELVVGVMQPLATACAPKAWWPSISLAEPIFLVAMHMWKGSKLFCRTVGPGLQRAVEDAMLRYREEERIQDTMLAIVEQSGLPGLFHKRTQKLLQQAFDEAHLESPYNTHSSLNLGMGFVMDFVYGWIRGFVTRAWDVLESGCGDREEQVVFVTALFKLLTSPDRCCIPHDLMEGVGVRVEENWTFIAQAVTKVFKELDAQKAAAGPAKKARIVR